jgi:hypothetical protein
MGHGNELYWQILFKSVRLGGVVILLQSLLLFVLFDYNTALLNFGTRVCQLCYTAVD